MIVRVFPPKESFSNQVNFESRYGTNVFFFRSAIIFMQFPSANRLLLMLDPSRTPFPTFSVFPFSEPARSIKVNLEVVIS